MIEALARIGVVLTGLYFITLASVSLFRPAQANRFLLGFAASARTHYAEVFVRGVVGAAFMLAAPRVLFSGAFTLFGGVLLVTTAGLLLIPWRWHQRFAQYAVPQATRYITLIGLASFVLGGLMVAAVLLAQ